MAIRPWIKVFVKARLPSDPDYPDQHKMEVKKKNRDCVLNAILFLEDNVSMLCSCNWFTCRPLKFPYVPMHTIIVLVYNLLCV